MAEPTSSDRARPLVQRFWWLYLLLALGNFALAGWHAGQGKPGWGINVLINSLLGLCFLGIGVGGRLAGRSGR